MSPKSSTYAPRTTFDLIAPAIAAVDSLASASVLVFERRFWTKLPPLGALALDVRILYEGADKFTLALTLSWGPHAFHWSRELDTSTPWRINLFAGFTLEVDCTDWKTSATQLTGTLVAKLTGPLGIQWQIIEPIRIALPHPSEIASLSKASLESFRALAPNE